MEFETPLPIQHHPKAPQAEQSSTALPPMPPYPQEETIADLHISPVEAFVLAILGIVFGTWRWKRRDRSK